MIISTYYFVMCFLLTIHIFKYSPLTEVDQSIGQIITQHEEYAVVSKVVEFWRNNMNRAPFISKMYICICVF